MKQLLIDGYNLLFLVGFPGNDLQEQRNTLIDALTKYSSHLNINLTLIFDSQYQKGECTSSHKNNIQIIYTNEGETADEHIIALIQNTEHSSRITLVTSDKRLACKARALHAKTQDVNLFFDEMKRRASKKIRPRTVAEVPIPIKSTKQKESAQDFYLRQFLHSYEELEAEATKPSTSPTKNKAKKIPKPPVVESDTARWLRLFQQGKNLEE